MLHKGASNIKAFYVDFNQHHFYLIYSPVLNFLVASKTEKWYFQFYTCKKITIMVTTGWEAVKEKSGFFFLSGKNLYLGRGVQVLLLCFFFSGKGQGILKTDVWSNHVTHKEKTMEW